MNGGAVRAARLLVFLVLIPCSAPAVSLRDRLRASSLTVGIAGGSAFDALADNIADTAARNLPIISASAGYTYRYNPQLEIFERTSETLGPLFLERPDTLGRGKLNVNVSYQYVQFDDFDGRSIKRLEAPDLDSGIAGGNHGSAHGGSHCRDDHEPGSGPDPSTARPTATAGALPVVESGPDAAFEPDWHAAADAAARACRCLRRRSGCSSESQDRSGLDGTGATKRRNDSRKEPEALPGGRLGCTNAASLVG